MNMNALKSIQHKYKLKFKGPFSEYSSEPVFGTTLLSASNN